MKDHPIADNSLEEKILRILSQNIMSTSQLSKELGVPRYIVAGYLEALRQQGKLEFFKVGKSNVYLSRGVKK